MRCKSSLSFASTFQIPNISCLRIHCSFYHYCHHFSVEISINYFTHFHLFPHIGLCHCQKRDQEDPCKLKSRVVGDATYCDRYWECVDGQPELYDCPNGLVFAGKNRGVTEGCDYPWRASYCVGKQTASEIIKLLSFNFVFSFDYKLNPQDGPISNEHCDWLYGIFGHETSCTRYWTCWNGTATEQLCIGGLLYNEVAHSCDWPEVCRLSRVC